NWQTAGAGVDGYVDAVADWQGQPVIGGGFTASAGTALPGVAIWDGTQWQPMGTRAVAVYSLRVEGGELYASGEFRLPDDSTASKTSLPQTPTRLSTLTLNNFCHHPTTSTPLTTLSTTQLLNTLSNFL